ncbi:hypothetical protein GQ53DRAFT_887837 [Thozetella sp. PMI_491]|nr:hypothetical protein GQ53DRAFT_887837 [Thozetella sp. PMI_491]
MRDVPLDCASRAPPFRLPDAVAPLSYKITIEPDWTTNTFNGQVDIELEATKSTSIIAFHALRLDLSHVTITNDSGDSYLPKVRRVPKLEAAFIQLEAPLHAGSKACLSIEYIGQIGSPSASSGLYRTPYTKPNGEVTMGFDTLMQPNMARAVYPCWDEPDRKAHFTVTMVVESDLTCLSNMGIASEEPVISPCGLPKKRVSFETTPKMSTYLLVLVAGCLNYLESNDFRVPVRVWAPVDQDINNAAYALDIAVRALKVHEKNFGIRYPLPKLDYVGLPGVLGAIEHWGCITCAQKIVLLGDRASAADKLQAQIVITHEIGHQWFGNIVTAKSWDAVWLNEAFANWATFEALGQMFPEFDYWANFVTGDFQTVLDLDANKGSHAIEDPSIPPEVAFDTITYVKGCSVIRMVARDLGTELFFRGVRYYLEGHLYGNATTEQLWDALGQVSGRDIRGAMAVWTKTVGYPLLKVQEDSRAASTFNLTQSRFFLSGEDNEDKKFYPINIHIRTSKGVTIHQMSDKHLVLPLSPPYKLNADQVGFYRVSYPLSRIHSLGREFHGGFLSVEDRVNIVSDLGAIVRTGARERNARLSDFLDFIASIATSNKDLFLWREILAQIGKIQAAFLFEPAKTCAILLEFKLALLQQFMQDGHLDPEPSDTIEQTLFKVLLLAHTKAHPKVQAKMKEHWNRLLTGDMDALDPDIRKVIFETVLLTDKTYVGFIRENEESTANDALAALGSSVDPELIARTIGLAGRLGVLGSLTKHPRGAWASWVWLRANWEKLVENGEQIMAGSHFYIGAALAGLATENQCAEVEAFFRDRTQKYIKLQILQSIEVIRAKARFVEADREDLLSWGRRRILNKKLLGEAI